MLTIGLRLGHSFLLSLINLSRSSTPNLTCLLLLTMATDVERIGANMPAADGNGSAVPNDINYIKKYASERDKRLGKGSGQYLDPKKSERLKHLLEDPWIESGTPIKQVVPDGGHSKFLIVGAGYGGILFAVELIKKGYSLRDIMIVDPAGGFGGTW